MTFHLSCCKKIAHLGGIVFSLYSLCIQFCPSPDGLSPDKSRK